MDLSLHSPIDLRDVHRDNFNSLPEHLPDDQIALVITRK